MVAEPGDGRKARRDKLRRAFGVAGGDRPTEPSPASGMRAFLQQRQQRFGAGRSGALPRTAVALPEGDVLATEHGPLWRRELRLPLTHRHGEVELGDARRFDGG
ncbi:MAG TPA: hypothetical protein ENI87_06255, partial [bacterium]|nr:hypothetical protein [bacterium]